MSDDGSRLFIQVFENKNTHCYADENRATCEDDIGDGLTLIALNVMTCNELCATMVLKESVWTVYTLNDFKNAPLFKIVCRRMNKVNNYTYVTDQLFKLCSHYM